MNRRIPHIFRPLRAALALVLAAGLLPGGLASAEPSPSAGAAVPVIEKLHTTILSSMKEAESLGFEGRYERLEPILRATFDFDFMAEKAVGRHWRTLEPADQERMRDVFARFTLATYASRFSGFSGERFETRSEAGAPRNTVFVRTELVRPEIDESIEINYRLHQTEQGWRVIDVLLRGTVSELALRRSEYSSVIKRDGFEALIANLEEKIDKLAEGEESPS